MYWKQISMGRWKDQVLRSSLNRSNLDLHLSHSMFQWIVYFKNKQSKLVHQWVEFHFQMHFWATCFAIFVHVFREIRVISDAVSNWKRTWILFKQTLVYFLRDLKSTLKVANTECDFLRWFIFFLYVWWGDLLGV